MYFPVAKQKLLFLFLLLIGTAGVRAQVVADAGPNKTICPSSSVSIGGAPSASGGTAPYTYAWFPANGLSNTTGPNPLAFPSTPTWYQLIVTDANGNKDTAYCFVGIDPVYQYNAGEDTSICLGNSLTLGAAANSTNGGVTFSWSPTVNLDNPNAPRPILTPTTAPSNVTYTVTIVSPNCPTKFSTINVIVNPLPVIDAGQDVTINEGEVTTLNATGGATYWWTPNFYITYAGTATPDVEPNYTMVYYVNSLDANGCYGWDSVTVNVIANDEVVIYNTFTPNGDEQNDYWYIGNILKYPNCRLEVFNRYGQQVYVKAPYRNDWDGSSFGDKLPEATYYYILDLGNGTKKNGSVTIVR